MPKKERAPGREKITHKDILDRMWPELKKLGYRRKKIERSLHASPQ